MAPDLWSQWLPWLNLVVHETYQRYECEKDTCREEGKALREEEENKRAGGMETGTQIGNQRDGVNWKVTHPIGLAALN